MLPVLEFTSEISRDHAGIDTDDDDDVYRIAPYHIDANHPREPDEFT